MRAWLVLPAAAALGGCVVGPTYKGPPPEGAAAVQRGRFVRAGDAALSAAPGLARWWEGLADPTLSALIDDALARSPDVAVAEARLREARARLRGDRAGLLPSLSASGTYLHARLPGTGIGSQQDDADGGDEASGSTASTLDFYNLGGTASWEPDLFGGQHRTVEQGRATLEQRFADLADTQVSLTAQVAQTYVNLRDTTARQAIYARSSMLQRRALDLTRQRSARGTASALDVARLENQLQQTDAQNTPLGAQIDGYKDALAVLTGRAPGELDAALAGDRPMPLPVPLPPAQVPIGDPGALIAHRPDVRAAERALAASTANIGIQTAKLYPSIKFYGILGLGGSNIGDVFDPGKLSTILTPMLSWPVLDFGRGKAAVRESEAQRDTAVAQYRQKVLAALQDAEDSLSRFGNIRRQLAQLVRAQDAADRAVTLNRQRFEAGTSSLVDQLDIERQRLSADAAAEQGKAQLTIAYIAVQKALGLGWSEMGPSPTPRQ